MAITSALRNNKTYFTALLLLVLSSFTLLLLKGKAGSFILLNRFHAPFLDAFFMGYTNLGDGLFALALVALVFFYLKQRPLAIALLLSYCISGILAQVLKHYNNMPRPALYFKPGQYTHFINGLHLATQFSFPSGHTTTAFALATVLAIFNKHKNMTIASVEELSSKDNIEIYPNPVNEILTIKTNQHPAFPEIRKSKDGRS
jgi:membrane-associated phospholipid phosphatase